MWRHPEVIKRQFSPRRQKIYYTRYRSVLCRFVVSPAAEEVEIAPEEEAEELQTIEVEATAVVEELPPPLPQESPATPTTPAERRRAHWMPAETDLAALGHHLTIGPSGGVEWVS